MQASKTPRMTVYGKVLIIQRSSLPKPISKKIKAFQIAPVTITPGESPRAKATAETD